MGAGIDRLKLHHSRYVYSSPGHFLIFCPRSQCNMSFFFFFLKPVTRHCRLFKVLLWLSGPEDTAHGPSSSS